MLKKMKDKLQQKLTATNEEMYLLGRKNCIKALKDSLSVIPAKEFTKENVLGLMDYILERE